MLDPISEMFTRIRNAQMARKKEVFIPFSKMKHSIAKILEQRGFVNAVQQITLDNRPYLKVVLRYVEQSRTKREPAIREITRMSRQGQRIYIRSSQIRRVKNGLGVAIISTSKGLMAGEEAYKQGLGGEFVGQVW